MANNVIQYYYYDFIPEFCLLVIILLTFIKAFKHKNNILFSIIVSLLGTISIISKTLFLGVLADNYSGQINLWTNLNWAFLIIIVLILVGNSILYIKNKKK